MVAHCSSFVLASAAQNGTLLFPLGVGICFILVEISLICLEFSYFLVCYCRLYIISCLKKHSPIGAVQKEVHFQKRSTENLLVTLHGICPVLLIQSVGKTKFRQEGHNELSNRRFLHQKLPFTSHFSPSVHPFILLTMITIPAFRLVINIPISSEIH